LEALLDATQAAVARGKLWAALDSASGNASDRVFAAQGICSFGKTNPARRRLRRATRLLDRYVVRLRAPAAQVISLDARNALMAEAAAITVEVDALRAHLACPIDS
jgi:hypothetical protein